MSESECRHVYEQHGHDMVCIHCTRVMTHDEWERMWKDLGRKED